MISRIQLTIREILRRANLIYMWILMSNPNIQIWTQNSIVFMQKRGNDINVII